MKSHVVVLVQVVLNNMNKKLLSIGLCALTLFSLTGCTEDGIEEPTNDSRFAKIKEYSDGYTCYDKDSGYVYFCDDDANRDGHTILLNEDGKPYKYEGWDK